MLGQVERYLKQAIVDKEAYVASAALVSGIYLMRTNADIVLFHFFLFHLYATLKFFFFKTR